MNMRNLIILLLTILLSGKASYAAILDTATIEFNWVTNTEQWSGGKEGFVSNFLTLPENSSLENFSVEITNISGTSPNPNWSRIDLCLQSTFPSGCSTIEFFNGSGTIVQEGDIQVIDQSLSSYDMLFRYVSGTNLEIPTMGVSAGWNNSVPSVDLNITYTLTANGAISSIPVPASIWLFFSGLALLGVSKRR